MRRQILLSFVVFLHCACGKIEFSAPLVPEIQGNGLDLPANTTFIYPGTHYCGIGNIARDSNDLGRLAHLDECCRDHDLCLDSIAAGETKYGLKNDGFFTRSHCDCDMEFYRCLKNAKSLHANNVGNIYFNTLKPKCFKKVSKQQCVQFASNGECLEFQATEEWDWHNSPKF